MKTILTSCILLLSITLSAQFASFPEVQNLPEKKAFNIQLNTSGGLGLNYERLIFQKGKSSIWGQAGISSNLPNFRKRLNSYQGGWAYPIGFSANLGLTYRWNFKEQHSLQIGGGVSRFQFYQPNKYKELFTGNNFDPLSKYLEVEYRFQPKNSRLFFTGGYRHTFRGDSNYGNLKFGIGIRF